MINKNPKAEIVNTEQTVKINQIDQITKETISNNVSKNIPQSQGCKGKSDSKENEQKIDVNKPLIEFENFNLKKFLSKINLLKNTNNYKIKGPYIYCAVVRKMNMLDKGKISSALYSLNLYHAGIFECTKKLIIYYGEGDGNNKLKPLSLELKNEKEIEEYQVYKYFYSKEEPETFINLIDKNEWTSERYSKLNHNCIHCANEYLILNNITPISFRPSKKQRNIAYPYLCGKCLNDLGRAKMYIKL